jgi:hypothetical protein
MVNHAEEYAAIVGFICAIAIFVVKTIQINRDVGDKTENVFTMVASLAAATVILKIIYRFVVSRMKTQLDYLKQISENIIILNHNFIRFETTSQTRHCEVIQKLDDLVQISKKTFLNTEKLIANTEKLIGSTGKLEIGMTELLNSQNRL